VDKTIPVNSIKDINAEVVATLFKNAEELIKKSILV